MEKKEIIKLIQDEISRSNAFINWRITDTPTDGFSVVNRGYSNMNGTVASRPRSSVATVGQRYLATDTGIPMTFTGTAWVDGVGSIVALAN